MSVDQLIAKALSTTSEEEAIACLRMARKKGGKLNTTSAKLVNGKDINWWVMVATEWHKKAVILDKRAADRHAECMRLTNKLNEKNTVSDSIRNFALIMLSCILLAGLFIL